MKEADDDRPRLLIQGRREAFYLVPPTVQLPVGPLVLRTPRGKEVATTSEAVLAYEVDRAVAMKALREELRDHLRAATANLRAEIFAGREEARARYESAGDSVEDRAAFVGGELRKTLEDPKVKAALDKLQTTLREGPRGVKIRREARRAAAEADEE